MHFAIPYDARMFPSELATSIPSCVLRQWRSQDKAALVRHANNRNVSRHLLDRFPFPYTDADADRWLAIAAGEGDDIHRAIEVDGEAAGGISAMRGGGNARFTAEIGYWLGEAHWGRGVMSATVRAFCGALFAHTDLERIEAGAFAGNTASHRVLEKSGFVRFGVRERYFHKDGAFIDDLMFARLRPR
jgi:RimJ/RimL family protein N-acetyltransferase